MTKRRCHSLSALQLSPHNVLLVIFGGVRSRGCASHTVLVELSEHYQCINCLCSTAAIVTDTAWVYTAKTHVRTSSHHFWCESDAKIPGGVGQDHVRQKLLTQRFANVWISQLNL